MKITFVDRGIAANKIMFRDKLRKFLAKYYDAFYINLGCSFDNRFLQVVWRVFK